VVSQKRLDNELRRLLRSCEEWELLEEVTPIVLDKYQRKVWKYSFEGFDWDIKKPLHLRYHNKVREMYLDAHRGYGKSFLEGCHRLVKMVSYPGWESYTCYPKREQAMYSLGYTQNLMKNSPYLRKMYSRAISKGKTQLQLRNGAYSFIISPSQRTSTGYHVNQGYIGEAARWADDWDEIFEQAILAMTNRKYGQIWLTSSSFGQRGFFYKLLKPFLKNIGRWVNDEEGMIADTIEGIQAWILDVDTTDIYDENDKKRFKKKGDLYYKQEYKCAFLGATETYIPAFIINKQSRVYKTYTWEDIVTGRHQIHWLGIDPGKSNGNLGVAGIRNMGNMGNFLTVYDEIAIDHYTQLIDDLDELEKNQIRCKKWIDSTGNQDQLLDWCESKGIKITGVDFANGEKERLMKQLSMNLRNNGFYLPKHDELCMGHFNYIPFELKGNHIKFPADYHALDALITIDRKFSNKSNFMMGGISTSKAQSQKERKKNKKNRRNRNKII
jgi:hypothetical protein